MDLKTALLQKEVEYTEAIENILDEKTGRKIYFGKQGSRCYACILRSREGTIDSSPGKDFEQAITRVFTDDSFYYEEIAFRDRLSLGRIQKLVDRFGMIAIRKQGGKIEIVLVEPQKVFAGENGDKLPKVLEMATACIQ